MEQVCTCEYCAEREAVFRAVMSAYAQGLIPAAELGRLIEDYSETGCLPETVIGGYRHRLTQESLLCPCERGFLCPQVERFG